MCGTYLVDHHFHRIYYASFEGLHLSSLNLHGTRGFGDLLLLLRASGRTSFENPGSRGHQMMSRQQDLQDLTSLRFGVPCGRYGVNSHDGEGRNWKPVVWDTAPDHRRTEQHHRRLVVMRSDVQSDARTWVRRWRGP